jgi:hypothetical protein
MNSIRKSTIITILTLLAAFALPSFAEEPAPTATGTAGSPAPCLVVSHASTVGKRLMWAALTGVPIAPGANYDYVDSTLHNVKMKYNGKELQKLQSSGVYVHVIEKHQEVTCANFESKKN